MMLLNKDKKKVEQSPKMMDSLFEIKRFSFQNKRIVIKMPKDVLSELIIKRPPVTVA